MKPETFVEQLVVWDSDYVNKKQLINHTPKGIIALSELEDQGLKDRVIAEHFGTWKYIIHCLN